MDSQAFEAIARSLLAGHGFVYQEPLLHGLKFFAFRSPGYSAFLALGLWLGGVTAAVAIQGALNGVSAALVGDLANRWAGARAAWIAFALRLVWLPGGGLPRGLTGAGARAAWIAFALRLVWLAGWFHAGQLMSESFFELTTILVVWLAVRAAAEQRLRWAIAAGGVATLAVLTRPVGIGCAPIGRAHVSTPGTTLR